MMLNDSDWVVRFYAAQRAPLSALKALLNDPEPDVVAVAKERLAQAEK